MVRQQLMNLRFSNNVLINALFNAILKNLNDYYHIFTISHHRFNSV
jgi:hypothetical protein